MKNTAIWASVHNITTAQEENLKEMGVSKILTLKEENEKLQANLANISEKATVQDLTRYANSLVAIAQDEEAVLVQPAGNLTLQAILARKTYKAGVNVLYAFSKRESVEIERDGKTIKTSTFTHVRFDVV